MYCPYAVTRSSTVQTIYKYNEDGTCKNAVTVETNEAHFVDCKQHECGAWQDNHCAYKP